MTARSRPPSLPIWFDRRTVFAAAALLCTVVWAVAGVFVWLQQSDLRERSLQGAELYARVLEDQASRSFAITDIALATLADTLDIRSLAESSDLVRQQEIIDEANAQMIRAVRGLPFLRSVSLVTSAGEILASSNPVNVGNIVSRDAIALNDPARQGWIGALLPVRDLGDLHNAPAQRRPGGPTLLPIVRRAAGTSPGTHWLIAAVNPDYFANQFSLMLNDEHHVGALVGYDGIVLAGTSAVTVAPGEQTHAAATYRGMLKAHENVSFLGTGINGERAISGFRSVRGQPLLVIFEEPEADAMRPLATVMKGAGLAALALTVMFGGLAAAALRSLRSQAEVTRRLAATDARRASSERDLRVLIEGVHEWMFRTDVEGRITFVNQRWTQISHHGEDAPIGRRVSDWIVEEDRATVDRLFDPARVADDRAHTGAQIGLCTAGGEVVALELSVSPLRDAQGALIGFAGFAVDVSERENARRRLQDQLDFTALLIDATPTPIFVKDVNGRYITANSAWCRLLGLDKEAVRGAALGAVLPSAELSLHERTDRDALARPETISYESRHVTDTGASRDLLITKVRFLGPDGEPAGVIGSVMVVSVFREAERSTRLAHEAAESANRVRAEFIANITHELRTPLQSIIGFSELGEARSGEHARLQQMFAKIHGAGERMLALVSNLLDVSKIESGVGGVVLERADLRLHVGEVLSEFEGQFESIGLRLDATITDEPCIVDVDATRFQQVVRNVVANAARFAPKETSLAVDVVREAEEVVVTVRDHGPGIPEAECEAIFEPFVQSSRTKDGSGGTGLGLAICRKIMHAHRGSIRAGNHPEGGAIFRIAMPLVPAGDEPTAPMLADLAL